MSKPLVSVITTVYNAQEYLNMAIDSILTQSYEKLEYIVIDDGSTDHSSHIIEAYADPRIKFMRQENQGLSASLNRGIGIAKGKYIARMDHDDISYHTRLEKQVDFLEKNPDVAMVGASFDLIDTDSGVIATSYHLDRNEDIQIEFLMRNPFGHGTVMIRKQVIDKVGGYYINQPVEDYELWWRVAKKHKVANIPERLYGYRVLPTGMSHGGSEARQDPITDLMAHIWSRTRMPLLTRSKFTASLNHYEDLGKAYREQYLYMLCSLTFALSKMGHPLAARNVRAKLRRVEGTDAIFKDLEKHPFSHNYNLGLINIMTARK